MEESCMGTTTIAQSKGYDVGGLKDAAIETHAMNIWEEVREEQMS